MIKMLTLTLLFSFSLFADITIAAAANVSYAMEELITTFHEHYPKIKVRVTFGSSGKLSAQINHGAPYDLFLSANMKYPQYLYDNALAVTKPRVYAKGVLVCFSTTGKDFSRGMVLLEENGIQKIAVANPKTAPYGKASVEAMKRGKVYDRIAKKLVYAESIAQTLSYAFNAVDIAFIAKSTLYTDTMRHFKEGVHYIEVDKALYTPIEQGIVVLKESDEANAFYRFLFSDEAQNILQEYGYITGVKE